MSAHNEQSKIYLNALKRMLSTEEGMIVSKYLRETFIEASAFSATAEETFYRLGQKEFVQAFLSDSQSTVE